MIKAVPAACPHNSKLLGQVEERICFDGEETGLILGGKSFDSLPEATRDKIVHMGMESYYNVLPRNICLLEKREHVSCPICK